MRRTISLSLSGFQTRRTGHSALTSSSALGIGGKVSRIRFPPPGENKRLLAEVERLDRMVDRPPPEPPEEPAPKPRLYVLALGDLEKRIVRTALQIPEASSKPNNCAGASRL